MPWTQRLKVVELLVPSLPFSEGKDPSFVDSTIERLRALAPEGRVLCALSGGVDSTVAAALLHRALGPRVTCIFVDNGLLRAGDRRMASLGRVDQRVGAETRQEEQRAEREHARECAGGTARAAVRLRFQIRPASTRCSATSTAPLAAPILVLCETSM